MNLSSKHFVTMICLVFSFLCKNSYALQLKDLNPTEPTMDLKALDTKIKGCETHTCLALAAYSRVKRDPSDATLAREYFQLIQQASGVSKESIESYFGATYSVGMAQFVALCGEIFAEETKESPYGLPIPLWMVTAEPAILSHDLIDVSKSIIILADKSISDCPHFERFTEALRIPFAGHWNTGTMYRYFYSAMAIIQDKLSYAPGQIEIDKNAALSSYKLNNLNLHRWAYSGVWNYIKYQELETAFELMAQDLESYYLSQPYLVEHATFATAYLNAYVESHYSVAVDVASEKAYAVFAKPYQDLATLNQQTADFEATDWTPALAYAILADYPQDALTWLITKGADVNGTVDEEGMLIKAVNRSDVLAFLIQQGTSLEIANTFDKTALFYAAQFNNLASVKILVEAGANVNARIKSSVDDQNHLYLLQASRGKKPLDYAIDNNATEIADYLKAREVS